MRLNNKILWAVFFLIPLLVVNANEISAYETDDYAPEITAKVSRISYLTGDVKIRRAGGDDWERAVLNLPVVDGDEIATDSNALLEIQFDRDNYLRLAQNSYLKILGLKDEGIAVSITHGSLSLRVLNFKKDERYFEIDAPNTTVSVQKDGMYRVDAGDIRSREIRVSVTEDGEARVYSVNSGFTLRNGRSAKIYVEGALAGEFETAEALRFYDEFDEWALKRDALIAKRLRDAYYDRYYDRDIYGAEDLNDYGEWIYTRDYGYVWRPYGNAVNSYQNWSPYRYGHWRWIPHFGWTWINDETWGWATYHHGRWIYTNGHWAWTPYGYYRQRRSWWSPALVVFVNVGNNVCWYPMPHRSRYRGYNNRNERRGNNNNNNPIVSNPNPVQPPVKPTVRTPGGRKLDPDANQTFGGIPASSVISVPISDFGRSAGGYKPAPADTARAALAKDPNAGDNQTFLPTYGDLNGRVSREIRAEKPPVINTQPNVRTGATARSNNAPLDKELRERQIFGNRQPIERRTINETNNDSFIAPNSRRDTGAVNRPAAKPDRKDDADQTAPPRTNFPTRSNNRNSRSAEDNPPVYSPPARQEAPPSRREEIRPPRREEPRYDPPPQKQDAPRNDPPPRREEPRNDPPKRDNSPPKSEPKDDSAPSETRRSKKDN
jgi:hypothetical protein